MAETPLPIVLMLDFLETAEVESQVLAGVAKVVCANATDQSQLSPDMVAKAEGFLMWHLVLADRQLLDKATNLKVISRIGMGYDNVDLEYTGKLGIYVNNIPDYGVEEVADSAMSHILNLLRKTYQVAKACQSTKTWCTDKAKQLHAERVRGKTLGIIGLGKIGSATVQRAKAFGMEVIFYDPYVVDGLDKVFNITRVDSLKDLMGQSDVISVHCWLDAKNHHLINAESLSWIKPTGAYLVNTARGGLVEEKALAQALKDGRLKGAAIDVVEHEPYPKDGVLFDDSAPNLILTPHVAFFSDEGFLEMRTKAALEIKRVLGEKKPPRNVVNGRFLQDWSLIQPSRDHQSAQTACSAVDLKA